MILRRRQHQGLGEAARCRQAELRRALEVLRFPELQKVKAQLEAAAGELVKASGLRFELPNDLEGDAVSVEVSARSPQDLRDISQRFAAAAEHPAAARLFAVLRGEE